LIIQDAHKYPPSLPRNITFSTFKVVFTALRTRYLLPLGHMRYCRGMLSVNLITDRGHIIEDYIVAVQSIKECGNGISYLEHMNYKQEKSMQKQLTLDKRVV
jgi:hypothetical protein